jgi:hypothetical protein
VIEIIARIDSLVVAEEMVAQAQREKNAAMAHYQFGTLLAHEGMDKHKDDLFARAHEELLKALAGEEKFHLRSTRTVWCWRT